MTAVTAQDAEAMWLKLGKLFGPASLRPAESALPPWASITSHVGGSWQSPTSSPIALAPNNEIYNNEAVQGEGVYGLQIRYSQEIIFTGTLI
jgi:hypothetical protein